MRVTVVDRAAMNRAYGTPSFHGVVLRTVDIADNCPTCGGPRGEPRLSRYHEWGEHYRVHNWTNECGHMDRYPAVLEEAERRRIDNAKCVVCKAEWVDVMAGEDTCRGCQHYDHILDQHPDCGA